MCGALPCGQDQRESQAILHQEHKLLFCQVEAEGLAGEGPESVPCSLPGQALEMLLLPGVDSPPQESSPHLIVHHQGQLPLSVGQGQLQKEPNPKLGVEVGKGIGYRELGQEVSVYYMTSSWGPSSSSSSGASGVGSVPSMTLTSS